MIDRAGLSPVQALPSPAIGTGPAERGERDFGSLLHEAIRKVEDGAADASRAAEAFLTGAHGDVHSVALAAQKASLQFEYFLQVRNKVVQAYQEVLRMQL